MKKVIKAGAVDQTLDIFIQDSTSTSGAGKTGLAFNTSGLKCYYRKGATGSATQLTLATQTVNGAHSDGGFVEIDASIMPGMYRLDLSDTIIASTGSVTLMLSGATGMAPLPIELQVGVDLEDTTGMGVSRLDAAITTRLAPTTAGRTLDVTATGEAGIDWANIGSPSSTVSLTSTTVGTSTALGTSERTAIADAIIGRNIAGGSSTGRTIAQALATLRNKTAIVAGVLTVYDTDDVTPLFEASVTQTAGNPVTAIDPTT